MATGGEALVRGLEALRVEVAFGLPGVHNLPAWEAFARSSIRLVGVRHEQAAAYAADGYARTTGRLGVAVTTTGPAAANTLAAVGEAWASGSPILVVATDIPTTVRRPGQYRGALHECTDQAAMFAPVTKQTFRAERATNLASLVAEAATTARRAPSRPVYLEVPTDLLGEETADAPETRVRLDAERVSAERIVEPHALPAARDLLASASRPLVWAGGGALRADAGPQVAALAARLAAPVLTTYLARGLLPRDHPCDVGAPVHVPRVGALWDEADLVVAIGTDFDGMMTQNWRMPQPPRLIAVNVDPVEAAKAYRPDVILVGDARTLTAALARAVPAREGLEALASQLEALRAAVRADVEAEQPAALAFLDAMEDALPEEAVVVADMCIPGYWLGAFHRPAAPRRFAYPMGWGTLGFAFPAALGAGLAGAGPVVSVSGDGGFLFACGELATMAQERVPLTAVIVDDGGYGMLRFDQRRAGRQRFGVELVTPDFAAMARAFGVPAETVDGLSKAFGAALAAHVADPHPSVLVAHAALDPPPNTSPRWYR